MFKIPQLPSRHSDVHELADFVELRCYLYGQTSSQEISRYLVREDDNQGYEGCDDSEDIIHDKMVEVIEEIDRRESACAGGYPFGRKQGRNGEVIVLDDERRNGSPGIVYLYLLLATRLHMNRPKYAGLDGTKLLERLSQCVIEAYLGSKSKSFLFGTAANRSFPDRVEELCASLGEGGGLTTQAEAEAGQAQDGGLDVAAWIPFADGQESKLIVFGQCKTGTDWRKHMHRTRLVDFAKIWLRVPIPAEPVPAHFVAESIGESDWRKLALSSGLLFDRCRLVEYGGGLLEPVLADLRAWTEAARRRAAEAMGGA